MDEEGIAREEKKLKYSCHAYMRKKWVVERV
jgi:hypothetical protein